MPDQEAYEQQLRILQAHRRTLAHYLEQKASFSVGHVPAHIAAGIQEARQEIAQIKRTIRAWGYTVDDNPMDGDSAEAIALVPESAQLTKVAVSVDQPRTHTEPPQEAADRRIYKLGDAILFALLASIINAIIITIVFGIVIDEATAPFTFFPGAIITFIVIVIIKIRSVK